MFSLRDLGLIFAVVFFAVMAVVIVRDAVRYVHQLRQAKASLTAEVTALKTQLVEATRTRDEILYDALDLFNRRQANKTKLNRLILRDMMDSVWQTDPDGVAATFDDFIRTNPRPAQKRGN